MAILDKVRLRQRRKAHIRKRIKGTADRPRMTVYRSLKHIYAQIIDDATGRTVLCASTLTPDLLEKVKGVKKKEAAKAVGLYLAERCKNAGIERVVFDRNGALYHGRVAAVADGAREGGLIF